MPRQKTEGSAGVRLTAKAAAACETSTRIGATARLSPRLMTVENVKEVISLK